MEGRGLELTVVLVAMQTCTRATRALVRISRNQKESIVALVDRVSAFPKVEYTDQTRREESVVPTKLVVYFTGALKNLLIRGLTWDSSVTFDGAFATARKSEVLFTRLG